MASPNIRVARAEREAAEWHARLGVRSVTTQTLEAFFAWRTVPENADAYRRVEKAWAVSGRLSGDTQMHAVLAEIMDRRNSGSRVRRRGALVGAAGAVAALAAAVGVWSWWDGRSVYATGVGEQRLVQLADGSTVRLDTASRIRVRFDRGVRRIELTEGQGLFTVAHDSGRPFVVRAGDAQVTAVGTVFDVRRNAADVKVTLVSGVVDVVREGGAAPSRMTAGQQARVTPARISTRSIDAATATSWTTGRLVFEDTPLETAVAEVNRYLEEPIVLEPGTDGKTPVSGVFRTGEREGFALAAAEGLGLRTRSRADGVLILSNPTK